MRTAVALDDALRDREADAGARDLAPVQALEHLEDPRRVARVDAGTVVRDVETPALALAGGRDRDLAPRSPSANLTAFPIRFWKTWRSSVGSARTRGSPPTSTRVPCSAIVAASDCRTSRTSSAVSTSTSSSVDAAGARVREEVVDDRLHPLDAGDREADESVRLLVELPLVAARQQVDEARDHPQRLGEVVRGDVGELLEFLVRAAKLVLGAPSRRDVAGDRRGADDPARARR